MLPTVHGFVPQKGYMSIDEKYLKNVWSFGEHYVQAGDVLITADHFFLAGYAKRVGWVEQIEYYPTRFELCLKDHRDIPFSSSFRGDDILLEEKFADPQYYVVMSTRGLTRSHYSETAGQTYADVVLLGNLYSIDRPILTRYRIPAFPIPARISSYFQLVSTSSSSDRSFTMRGDK